MYTFTKQGLEKYNSKSDIILKLTMIDLRPAFISKGFGPRDLSGSKRSRMRSERFAHHRLRVRVVPWNVWSLDNFFLFILVIYRLLLVLI